MSQNKLDADLTVEIAEEKDSELLKKFTLNQPFLTNGPIELVIDRKGSFFDRYRLQTDDFVTFKLMDGDSLEGIVSMLFRKTILDGEEKILGFTTDLRISNSRKAILQWPEKLLPVMTQVSREHKCDFVFTILNSTQSNAYNALIRPRSQRRNLPRYFLYKRYDLITIHGKVPFSNLPLLSSIKISPMTKEDLEPTAHYLKSKALNRPLSFPYSEELLQSRFNNWQGFEMENFLIAKDYQGNIIGCVAPWKASQILEVQVQKYNDFGKTIYTFSRWFSYFKFVKRLPPEGRKLDIKFLTHFYADNPDIFASLLAESFRITKTNELLAYPHIYQDALTLPPKSFLSSRLPFSIYSILPADKPIPDFLQPHWDSTPPEIEPILL